MIKSYEAIYAHGRLCWLHHTPPDIPEGTRVIVVMDLPQNIPHTSQESIRALLQRTRGTSGQNKTIADIDDDPVEQFIGA